MADTTVMQKEILYKELPLLANNCTKQDFGVEIL